jgi:hypothetical protein
MPSPEKNTVMGVPLHSSRQEKKKETSCPDVSHYQKLFYFADEDIFLNATRTQGEKIYLK